MANHTWASNANVPGLFRLYCPFAVGDTTIALSLIGAYCAQRGITRPCPIVKPGHSDLVDLFPSIREKIVISDNEMHQSKLEFHAQHIYETPAHLYCHFPVHPGTCWLERKPYTPGMDFYDEYKRDVFHLPINTPVQRPEEPLLPLQRAQELSRMADPARTILLVPHAYSVKWTSAAFWNRLASVLAASGYTVYTNTGLPAEQPIAGTLPLRLTLSELLFFTSRIRNTVAGRCGLCDLLAMAGRKMIVIDPMNSIELERTGGTAVHRISAHNGDDVLNREVLRFI